MANSDGKIVPEGRRLDKGMRPTPSKYAARSEGQRLADLEKSRQKLGQSIEAYAKLLVDNTLPENRLTQDKDLQKTTLESLPKFAAELDLRNVGEGTQSLIATLLNSVFVLRDQVNKLKYQVYFLNQKVEKKKEDVLVPKEPSISSEREHDGATGN